MASTAGWDALGVDRSFQRQDPAVTQAWQQRLQADLAAGVVTYR